MLRITIRWFSCPLLLLTMGCVLPELRPAVKDDSEGTRYKIRTIGDLTTVGNAEPIRIGGVGMVTGLHGTGGGAPPGRHLDMFLEQQDKQGVENPRRLLASRDNALVVVSATIPAGARKGDFLDVEVTLPPHSRAVSLRDGQLKECTLYTWLNRPGAEGGALLGHALAKAAGSVTVDTQPGHDGEKLKKGIVWGGARCSIDRDFYLVFNNKKTSHTAAQALADAINSKFHGPVDGPREGKLAEVKPMALMTKTELVIALDVPPQYRRNLARYLRMIRLIPLSECRGERDEGQAGTELTHRKSKFDSQKPALLDAYRRQLEADLLDPAWTVTAALRLEALGNEGVPILSRGLTHDCPLVRFSAAEALAYLGSTAGVGELVVLAKEQPALRLYCLTALSALDEGVARVKLGELLAADDSELRHGAFQALRKRQEQDPALRSEWLNRTFWLYGVATDSEPIIHVATRSRPEVVLFGEGHALEPPFALLAGEFAIKANPNADHCTLSRLSLQRGVEHKKCSLKLEDILRAMAGLSCTYHEVLELFDQARTCRCLNCAVVSDVTLQETSIYDLDRAGKDIKSGKGSRLLLPGRDRAPSNSAPAKAHTAEELLQSSPPNSAPQAVLLH